MPQVNAARDPAREITNDRWAPAYPIGMRLPDSIDRSFGPKHWVLRPVVLAVLVYGTLLRFASLYFLSTMRFPTLAEDPAYGAGWDRLGAGLTVLNLALAGLLLHELLLARKRGAALRRAHYAGAVIGLAYLASLQFLVIRSPAVFEALLPSGIR